MPATENLPASSAKAFRAETDLMLIARRILDDFDGDPAAFFRATKPSTSDPAQEERHRREVAAVLRAFRPAR